MLSLVETFGLRPIESLPKGTSAILLDIAAHREAECELGVYLDATSVDAWHGRIGMMMTETTGYLAHPAAGCTVPRARLPCLQSENPLQPQSAQLIEWNTDCFCLGEARRGCHEAIGFIDEAVRDTLNDFSNSTMTAGRIEE